MPLRSTGGIGVVGCCLGQNLRARTPMMCRVSICRRTSNSSCTILRVQAKARSFEPSDPLSSPLDRPPRPPILYGCGSSASWTPPKWRFFPHFSPHLCPNPTPPPLPPFLHIMDDKMGAGNPLSGNPMGGGGGAAGASGSHEPTRLKLLYTLRKEVTTGYKTIPGAKFTELVEALKAAPNNEARVAALETGGRVCGCRPSCPEVVRPLPPSRRPSSHAPQRALNCARTLMSQ